MGQALYRKYRSKSLSEIVGQKHITDTLSRAIKSGKISHAYLFTGPKGVGKTSIARILAHEVNGLPYTDESIHLDIIEIDAASNRRIDEIRDLRDKVHIAPTSAKYKVYIIDEVHMLTKEAFNALLKTLEEPPAHVIFILATTEAHKLPETIVSRTQKFTFKAIEQSEAVEYLRELATKEGMSITDDALELLAEHGGGSFRDAIGLLDQIGNSKKKINQKDVEELIGLAPKQAIAALLQATLSAAPSSIVECLDGFTAQGIAPAQIAKQLAKLLRTRIIAGDNSSEIYISLLAELLAVPASSNPGMSLEIALFSARTTQPVHELPIVPATKVIALPKPQTRSTEVPQALETTETTIAKKPVIKDVTDHKNTIVVSEDISSWWPQLTDSIKKHNNTLYGILRMAHPSLNGNTLRLSFAFGFHAKKIADAQTSGKLRDIVKELTGKDIAVEVLHDKELKGIEPSILSTPPAVLAHTPLPVIIDEPAHDLGAITSIFGGGEVLES